MIGLQRRLRALPCGRSAAGRFELLTALVFKKAFWPHAIDTPVLQASSPSPNYRRDIVLPVTASNGQWHYWALVYGSDLIMVECKNYTEPIGAPQVDDTVKYLRRPGLAKLAFIATRKPPSAEALATARDVFRSDGKLFVFLCDDDLTALAGLAGAAAEVYLRKAYQQQKMSL
jgi:hypothetical protein